MAVCLPVDSVYGEYGLWGVVVSLFSYMILNLIKSQKAQTDDLEKIKQYIRKMESVNDNTQSIVLKFLDRWNSVESKNERRFEKNIEMQNNVTDTLNYIMGKLNNKGG